jgi:hypothetical protein
MRGLLLAVSALLTAAWTLAAAEGEPRTRPVLLLPGFASSQLQAWSHSRCETGFRKNLYRDVNIGDRASAAVLCCAAPGCRVHAPCSYQF